MTEHQGTVSRWLQAAGAEAGIPMALDAEGQCNIVFGQQLECMVEVPEDADSVFIYTSLARPPDDPADRIRMLEQALELNLFSIATGGASVSYDRRIDEIVLTFSMEVAAMDEAFFKEALGDMLDLAIDLHRTLNETLPAMSTPAPEPKAPSWDLRA